ncbi:DNA repair and recombination protein RAD52 [Meyerozyma sp. JA9]|nr:DNA repair and recombination protein RAD52 [Meyerozyma sp. JA9]
MNQGHNYTPERRPESRLPFVPTPYTPEEQKRISEKLDRILGPEYVSFRPGGNGQKVSYIEGWKALNLANEIFGFNGWCTELVGYQVDYLDTSPNGRISLGISVVVRLTLKDGTFHEDFGYGFIDNAKSKSMAFEKCKKEAFTDAIKRCLRCFGNVLGNCLYDRTILPKIQKMHLPPIDPTPSQFHREPELLRREKKKEDAARHSGPNVNPQTTRAGPVPAAEPEPAAELKHEVDDFDDSFMFSDDVDHNGIDEYELQMLEARDQKDSTAEKPQETNEQTEPSAPAAPAAPAAPVEQDIPPSVFVSARKVDDIRQAKSEVTSYDTKYVSPSIRRTVDPNKSVPIKRTTGSAVPAAPAPKSPAATAAMQPVESNNGYADPPIGKRLLGRPPSQRISKRLRSSGESSDQENRVPTEFPSSFSS